MAIAIYINEVQISLYKLILWSLVKFKIHFDKMVSKPISAYPIEICGVYHVTSFWVSL